MIFFAQIQNRKTWILGPHNEYIPLCFIEYLSLFNLLNLFLYLVRNDIRDVDGFLLLPQEAQVVRHQVQEDHLHPQGHFQLKRLGKMHIAQTKELF